MNMNMNIDFCNLEYNNICTTNNSFHNIENNPTLSSCSLLYINFLYFFNLYENELNIKNNIEETQIIKQILIER
jgi:hypothetical protein